MGALLKLNLWVIAPANRWRRIGGLVCTFPMPWCSSLLLLLLRQNLVEPWLLLVKALLIRIPSLLGARDKSAQVGGETAFGPDQGGRNFEEEDALNCSFGIRTGVDW